MTPEDPSLRLVNEFLDVGWDVGPDVGPGIGPDMGRGL